MNSSNKIEPYKPRLSKPAVILLGNKSNKMCEPSSGGIGIRLKAHKNILKKTPYQNRLTTSESFAFKISAEIRNPIKKIIARIKLENGPAAETIASSLYTFLKFLLSTGTGFAHPINAKPEANEATGMIMVPIISACLKGLRLSLPEFLAVLSPSLLAVNA
jgi:hypothetical protein